MFKVRTVFLFNATFVHVTPIRSLPCYAQKWARPVQEKEWPSKYDKWMYKQNRTNSLLEDLIIAGFVISCRFFFHYDLDPSWANFSANKHCANRCYSAFLTCAPYGKCTLWRVMMGHLSFVFWTGCQDQITLNMGDIHQIDAKHAVECETQLLESKGLIVKSSFLQRVWCLHLFFDVWRYVVDACFES